MQTTPRIYSADKLESTEHSLFNGIALELVARSKRIIRMTPSFSAVFNLVWRKICLRSLIDFFHVASILYHV